MDRQRMLIGWRRAARKFYKKHPQSYQRVVRFTADEVEQIERNRRPSGNPIGVGVEVGRFFVWERADKRFWWCACACGEYLKVATRTLLAGKKTDCGCLKEERERIYKLRWAA